MPPLKFEDYLGTCGWGCLRGSLVTTLLYPLEVVKIELQRVKNPPRITEIVHGIYQRGGFYRGLSPQLVKILGKQPYCWPIIAFAPERIPGPFWVQQGVAGLILGTADALTGTPLERWRFGLLFQTKKSFSWKGFTAQWLKLSVLWSTFLISQRYYRSQEEDQKIPLDRLMIVGTKTAFWASLAAAPFDLANTLTQSQNLSPSLLWKMRSDISLRRCFRGWPLSAISMLVNNISSVILLDLLNRR